MPKKSHLTETIEALTVLVEDNYTQYPTSMDNVFIVINTSLSYGFDTKLIKIDPFKYTVNDLIKAGITSNNVFRIDVYDYSNYDVIEDYDKGKVEKISLLTTLNETSLEADKNYIAYILPKSSDYDFYTINLSNNYYNNIVLEDTVHSMLGYPNIKESAMDFLYYASTKYYDLIISENILEVEINEAYEDDPGCGLYYFNIKEK